MVDSSGKYCSSCNAPQLGNWEYIASEDDWYFVDQRIEHHITCSDINAPVFDHIDWDVQAIFGTSQPTIPRPFGPTREGSKRCESGSLASGGDKTYCTCDICW